jgi:putative membrane protein insertion efficiency factor
MDVRGVWAAEVEVGGRVVVGLALALIRIYRFVISPLLPRCCRFIPSCSEYAEQALRKHGVLRGSKLSVLRILRCHPFGGSGEDPVP